METRRLKTLTLHLLPLLRTAETITAYNSSAIEWNPKDKNTDMKHSSCCNESKEHTDRNCALQDSDARPSSTVCAKENPLEFRQGTILSSNMASIEKEDVEREKNSTLVQNATSAEDCIFCHIVQGRAPAFKLYEDENCICILDSQPLSFGHSLIIPRAHFPSLRLTPPQIAAAMCFIVPHISNAIMEATSSDSFNLLVNSGIAAGQMVFHTHFHIIPRRLGDHLWRSENAHRRQLPSGHETYLLVQQIQQKLSDLPLA